MNYLGLDIGTKRTGVALADGGPVRPLMTLETSDQLAEELKELCEERTIDTIVIGLPYHEDGQPSEQMGYVEKMAAEIELTTERPVVFIDEVLTSIEADRRLQEAGLSEAERKAKVDMVAAQLILEQYLEEAGAIE